MRVIEAIVIVLVIGTIAGDTRTVRYQCLPIQNVIFSNDLLFESRAWTKAQCSLLCVNYAGCVTFTFTKNSTSSGTCRGHSAVQQSGDPQTAEANTLYYRKSDSDGQSIAGNCRYMQTTQPGSGVRLLNVTGIQPPVSAYCDQDTDGGGWTVIQRRQDGSVDFNRTWAEYQAGFGDPAGEYWLGLETVYRMTTSQRYEIRFDLQMYTGTTGFAVYSNFSVGPGSDFYRLSFSTMTAGNVGDQFWYNKQQRFATRDNDSSGCVGNFGGGWWYRDCNYVTLNGPYSYSATCPSSNCWNCPAWHTVGLPCSLNNALQKAAMKIRPAVL